jgi:hypothetical protein
MALQHNLEPCVCRESHPSGVRQQVRTHDQSTEPIPARQPVDLGRLGGCPKVRVSKLRAEDLDRWYAELRLRGLAPASVRKLHNSCEARWHCCVDGSGFRAGWPDDLATLPPTG